MDAGTSAFAAATGLACPSGCGACCHSPEVESSVVDLLPAAFALFEGGRAESLLERLGESPDERVCALYEPDAGDPLRGRCSLYEQRPSLCRLFGFTARRDRLGQPEFLGCREHGSSTPEAYARAVTRVASGAPVQMLADEVAAVASEAGPSAAALPINQALRAALERVGLQLALSASEVPLAALTAADDDGPRHPNAPRAPRRAA